MRWLYHLTLDGDDLAAACAPASLGREGFVHASYRDAVRESARLYFTGPTAPSVLQIDPRQLDVPVDLAVTPRGVMPHIEGVIPPGAVRRVWRLDDFDAAPDEVIDAPEGEPR